MKILSALFLLFSFSLVDAPAQENEPSKEFKIGGKFIAERCGDYSLTAISRPVYSGGIQLVGQIKSISSIETGLYLITKGLTISRNPDVGVISEYITLPLNYRIDLKIASSFVYVSSGIFVDYMVGTRYINMNKSDNVRQKNAGMNINVGVETPLTQSLNILAEIRYASTMQSPLIDPLGYDHIGSYYINYGVAVGLNYKIGRHN